MSTENSPNNASTAGGLFAPAAPTEPAVNLEQALIEFLDELADFASVNAFVVTSYSMMIAANEEQRMEVAVGAAICADSMISRSNELKHRLSEIQERYRAG